MFKCISCNESVGPRIKPVTVITGIRSQSYHNEYEVEDEWGNKQTREVDSTGSEITGEALMCPGCAGVSPAGTATARALFGKPQFAEKVAVPFRIPLASVVIDNVLTALAPENVSNDGARFAAQRTVPIIKEFADNNKGITL